jgi:phospholipid/cholesterol/gamma-HCH transport system substrate-binding protein
VTGIGLKGKRARVTMELPRDYPIYRDASASLSAIGILGEKYIELDPGHPEAGRMAENNSIPSKVGPGLDNLMQSLADITQNVKGVTAALNQSIGGEPGREKLDEIMDNIHLLTANARAIGQENHGSINEALFNATSISAELKEKLPLLAQRLDELGGNLNRLVTDSRPDLRGMVADIRVLASNLEATSANLRSITGKINAGEGSVGKLLNDEATVTKVNQAIDNASDLMGGIKAMELRLDLSTARWTRRGDGQSGLDLELAPKKDYWYSLGLHSTPDGKVTQKTEVVTSSLGATATTREVRTDQEATISAQFNKRLGDNFVVSAGLVEGKGGGSIEYRALDDRFRIQALAYDFGKREGKPNSRYRLTTSYQFWKGMYAQTGAQDLANPELKTFFFGGGLRWKDDDIKKLVGLLGSAAK